MVKFICDRCTAPADTDAAKEIKPITIPQGAPFDKAGVAPAADFDVNIPIVPLADLCPTCLQTALLIRLKQLGA